MIQVSESRLAAVVLGFCVAAWTPTAPVAWAAKTTAARAPQSDTPDWTLDDAYRVSTPTRDKICLNGMWRISLLEQPAFPTLKPTPVLSRKEQILRTLNPSSQPPAVPQIPEPTFLAGTLAWKEVCVPSRWVESQWFQATQHEAPLGTLGATWNGQPLSKFPYAWYEREFKLPDGWKAGESFLEVDGLKLEGWVFLNGKFAGYQKANQSHDIPLPPDVTPRSTVRVDVLVGAQVTGMQEQLWGNAQEASKSKASSPSRGLTGDVWLMRRPAAGYVQHVSVLPSVRKMALVLRVEFNGSETPSTGTLAGELRPHKQDKTVKAFRVDLSAGRKVAPGTLEFEVPWADPVYWTPENPFLYDLALRWEQDGQVRDVPLPVRFGFREVWIQGRDLYLNGWPLRLRMTTGQGDPTASYFRSLMAQRKAVGFNCVEQIMLGGDLPDHIFDVADEIGVIVLPVLPYISPYIPYWQTPEGRKAWQDQTLAYLRRMINHPAVAVWVPTHNLLGDALSMHPDYLGTDFVTARGDAAKVAADAAAFIRGCDPSRPVMNHAGANYGDIASENVYLNFAPLQEKEEWLGPWAAKGTKPFITVELGMPLDATYFHGRMGWGTRKTYMSEPCMAEYAARVVGPSAYGLVPDDFLKTIVNARIFPGILKGSDQYNEAMGWFYGPFQGNRPADYLACESVLSAFLRNWRTWGITGMNPWVTDSERWNGWSTGRGRAATYASLKTPGNKPRHVFEPAGKSKTPLWDKYREWLSPELLYIAGPKAVFTDKQHAYFTGADIVKSVAFVNDTQAKVAADVRMELVDAAGKVVATRALSIANAPGEISLNELAFKAPAVERKTALTLRLTRREAGQESKLDEFAVQVFPVVRAAPAVGRNVLLIDSKGLTAALLKQAGVPCSPYNGQPLTEKDLLVVGRESLAAAPPADTLRQALANGLNMIVMEQTAADLEGYLGLRAVAASARNVFLGVQPDPVFGGLSDEDMSNWTGEATLLAAYPKPAGDFFPTHVWKWGNRGIVASVTIEKPHKGGYLDLAHEGFDLNYTPLLEERVGKGSILFNQLDLSGRTENGPVVDLILRNMLARMDRSAGNANRPVFLSAGLNVRNAIMDLGVTCVPADDFSKLPADGNGILILGDVPAISKRKATILANIGVSEASQGTDAAEAIRAHGDAINAFMQAGGTVMLLGVREPDTLAAALGAHVGRFPMQGYHCTYRPLGELTQGLTDGDYYWKDTYPLPLPAADSPLAEAAVGKGRLLVCQLDPFHYSGQELHQRRMRARIKMLRIIGTMLTHLGAPTRYATLDVLGKGGGDRRPVDLEGPWNFRTDPKDEGVQRGWSQTPWTDGFRTLSVPGSWESQGVTEPNPNFKEVEGVAKRDTSMPYDGYAWYQKAVVIPAALKGRQLYLEMGTVDDCDWTYFNGAPIGSIDTKTKGYWMARRLYPIPADSIHYGQSNLIAVRVLDIQFAGGILKGPVRLSLGSTAAAASPLYDDASVPAEERHDPYLWFPW